jgi:hypothetical protein
MRQCHCGGRCGAAQGATYAYSAMFMALALVKTGVLPPSLPEHHSLQNPSGGAAIQVAGAGRWAARSDDGRAGPGYPVGRYESGHIEPAARRLNSNAQPWIVFGGGWDERQRRVTSDAMTDRRHPDGKVAMALGRTGSAVGRYAWIAARQAATMAEPHSLTHDAQTRLHLAPRRRLNSCHQYPASAVNSARGGNSVAAQTMTAS